MDQGAASGPGRAGALQEGQVCCKWVKWDASGNRIVPPEKSLCEGDCCGFQAFYSLLSAGDPPDPGDPVKHFLACRLTQSFPQALFILRETLGKWIQAYTATCNTLNPLEIPSTHLAHLQHTCPTWPTCNTLDTLGPLAPLDLGRLRQLGREWIECGKCVAAGSSVSQVGQVRRKWVKCVASASSASQVGQVRRKWVRCVARASVSSGPSVLQVGQEVAIA